MKTFPSFRFLLAPASLAVSLLVAEEGAPDPNKFGIRVLSLNLTDPMEIAVAGDGRVFIAERTGTVKLYDPNTKQTTIVLALDVALRRGAYARECGLLGVAVHPTFPEKPWVYLFYSGPDPLGKQRLSRFTFARRKLDPKSEKIMLKFGNDRDRGTCHEGGSMAFGPKGNLFLSTGDNTNPFESNGYGPIDERKDRRHFDAQRSAANTNDLRGKILRVRPTDDGGYAIPEGNLFPAGSKDARPEIFAMGCRNPFRMSVDSETGTAYWGEVGPDSGRDGERGPRGYCEINRAATAGYYGWPYFVADNKPYADFDFAARKVGDTFNPAKPRNDSVNNTGKAELPPARGPIHHYSRSCAMAGPVYRPKGEPALGAFPAHYAGRLFFYDWNRGWFKTIRFDDEGGVASVEPFLGHRKFTRPMDVEFGPGGRMFLLEYGSGWYDNKDGRLLLVSYGAGDTPVAGGPASDPRFAGIDLEHPGAKIMAKSDCIACHLAERKIVGPSFKEIRTKYGAEPKALDNLAKKVLTGGKGVWGPVPMPPHPFHTMDEAREMIRLMLAPPKK